MQIRRLGEPASSSESINGTSNDSVQISDAQSTNVVTIQQVIPLQITPVVNSTIVTTNTTIDPIEEIDPHILQLQYRDIDENDYDALIALHEQEQKPSCLPQYAVDMLSTELFSELSEAGTCTVCLDDFELHQRLKKLPCSHSFHQDCIDEWLLKHSDSCAMCNQKVFPDLDQLQTEVTEPILSSDTVTNVPLEQTESQQQEEEQQLEQQQSRSQRTVQSRTKSRPRVHKNLSKIDVRRIKQTSLTSGMKDQPGRLNILPSIDRNISVSGLQLQNIGVESQAVTQQVRVVPGRINKERPSRMNSANEIQTSIFGDLVIGSGTTAVRAGSKPTSTIRSKVKATGTKAVTVQRPQLEGLLQVSATQSAPSSGQTSREYKRPLVRRASSGVVRRIS
jgi:hypothetical protein